MENSEDQLFREWQQAVIALRAAVVRGDEDAALLRLSADVMMARNALTQDQFHGGWSAPGDVLRHLTRDDQLLHESDAELKRYWATSAIPAQRTDA